MRASPLLVVLLLLASAHVALGAHPQHAGGRTATFDHKTGNDWWVEVIVTGSPARVEARDDGGSWKDLALKSWGAWGASFRIEPGHRVQFRASWDDGASVESCWFTHPEGDEQCASPPPPPPPGGASPFAFTHGGGNEWWVEAKVEPKPVAVEAMDTGGPWVALAFKSWGEWAESFHVEPGHEVRFRAKDAEGVWHESCWFSHPAGASRCGTPPPPPPDGASPYAFTHGGGNEWWVEAKVSPRPAAVESMDAEGPWVPLTFRSWGEWAGSFRVEPGHEVRFRAKGADGVWHESCWFSHPAGAKGACPPPTLPPPSWPTEGSFVRYEAVEREGFPGYRDEKVMNVTYRWTGGAWSRHCEGWSREWISEDDPEWARYSETRHDEMTPGEAPPRVAGSPRPGDDAEVPGTGCTWGGAHGTAFGPVRRPAVRLGAPVQVVASYVEYAPVWPAHHHGAWDATLGLVLSWSFGGSHSSHYGRLVDTDAPLTVVAPARTSWPYEGSHASYRVTEDGGSTAEHVFRFTDGGWQRTCTVREPDGTTREVGAGSRAPFQGPVSGVRAGDRAERPLPDLWCGATWDEVIVERSQSVTTTRDGRPYTARVWYADEDDSWTHVDYDLWWDTATGLYLEWDHNEAQAKLVDTDAPLARG